MKIILSRKGFDSQYGGCPSPILPDGTLLSLPIPGKSRVRFSDLQYRELSYDAIWKQIAPTKYQENMTCHLDPDIRIGIRKKSISRWQPAFGQTGAAQGHLQNQCIGPGDLFLFFGWFRETVSLKGSLQYKPGASGGHIIYGYLQIGEIIKGTDILKLYWHPHAEEGYGSNNTIYLPSKELVFGGQQTGFSGSGTLSYDKKLVLTKENCSPTRWSLLPWMEETSISYCRNAVNKADGYFRSASKGQEFVVSEHPKVEEWARSLICSH